RAGWQRNVGSPRCDARDVSAGGRNRLAAVEPETALCRPTVGGIPRPGGRLLREHRARLHSTLAIAARVLAASGCMLLGPAGWNSAAVHTDVRGRADIHLYELVGRSVDSGRDVCVSVELDNATATVQPDRVAEPRTQGRRPTGVVGASRDL